MSDLRFDAANHRYYLGDRELPSVTTVLQDVGLVDYSFLRADQREEAMLRGRWVMDLVALYLNRGRKLPDAFMKGLRDSHPDWMLYFDGWRRFEDETGFQPVKVEQRLFSETYGYAGTADLIGLMNDDLVLPDVKTGIATSAAFFQTAAYLLALGCLSDYEHRDKLHKRFAIELHDDGTYKLIAHKDYARDRKVFLSALTVYNAKERRPTKETRSSWQTS
jgi:hypothetical protein